jgi:RNA polymerase sigma factor (sigma-70 family)
VERSESIKLVNEIIDYLPKKYKELIVLKYFEELTYEDIAKRLNMSPNEVKWKLHQARKKMVQLIEENQQYEGRCSVYGM